MRDFIADKRVIDTTTSVTHSAGSIDAARGDDDEHEENKKSVPEKGRLCDSGWSVSKTCSLEKALTYVEFAQNLLLRVAIHRGGQMPEHKDAATRKITQTGGFNAKGRTSWLMSYQSTSPKLAANWKDYWTYDRQERKFSPANKEDTPDHYSSKLGLLTEAQTGPNSRNNRGN